MVNTEDKDFKQKFKKSGLSLSVSNSLINPVVSSGQSLAGSVNALTKSNNARTIAFAGFNTAMQSKNLMNSVSGLLDITSGTKLKDKLKGATTRVAVTVGSQKNESTGKSHTETYQGSQVLANGDVTLTATGAGKDSNIIITGSDVSGSNVTMNADNDVQLLAHKLKNSEKSSNKSSGASFGLYGTFGPEGSAGGGITVGFNRGKGFGNGKSTTHANSHINASDTFTVNTGNDLVIKGGVVNADKAKGRIKGDLVIESLQDTATYKGEQENLGVSIDADLQGVTPLVSLPMEVKRTSQPTIKQSVSNPVSLLVTVALT